MGARPSSFVFTQLGPLRLYSTADLMALPPPEWLIDNILVQAGLSLLYAPPESYKSFVAIDLALCVATGTPWHGHTVKKGFVLFIAAEGGPGIGKRVRAWLKAHDLPVTAANVAWLIESITVVKDSEDMDRLTARLDDELERAPALIIIDTLARCFDGDENQQEDMGRFVAGIDKWRHQYGSCILAIHHTRLDGDRERGNTALRGGLDTMIQLARTDRGITLSCAKQKDADHFAEIDLEFRPIDGTGSGVVVAPAHAIAKAQRDQLILQKLADAGELSWDALFQVSGMSKSTFHRTIVELAKNDKIIKEKGLWRVIDRG